MVQSAPARGDLRPTIISCEVGIMMTQMVECVHADTAHGGKRSKVFRHWFVRMNAFGWRHGRLCRKALCIPTGEGRL